MNTYMVQYQLPYTHIVTVGVVAANEQEACAKARVAFEEGTIWNNTEEMPLLQDCYEESSESDVLEFSAIAVPSEMLGIASGTRVESQEVHNSYIDIANETWTKEEQT